MGAGQTDTLAKYHKTVQIPGGGNFAVLPVCCPRGKVLCRSKPAAGHPVGAPGRHHRHPPPEKFRDHTKSLSLVRAPTQHAELQKVSKNIKFS